MNAAIINEIGLIQGNHTPGDAISTGRKVLKVTIKCAPDSVNNALVGVNEEASNKNLLQPGESVTYHVEGYYLDGNRYYVGFDETGGTSGGKALVSVMMDSEKEVCN